MCVFSFPRELAELQKANAVTQSAAQEAALSAEQSAREELKGVLDQQKLGAQREKEALLMQVSMSVSVFPYNFVIPSYSFGVLHIAYCNTSPREMQVPIYTIPSVLEGITLGGHCIAYTCTVCVSATLN